MSEKEKKLQDSSDYSADSIASYYKVKEERQDSQQFVKENNKQSLAQVFTDIRYKKTDNVYFSKTLLKVLKDQGFLEQ